MTDQNGTAATQSARVSLQVDKSMQAYVQLPFEVPPQATRFDMTYTYPKSEECIIDLGLGNPDLTEFPSEKGIVGWSGGARREIFVASDSATPGYRPGLMHGTWQILLGLHRVPDTPITVEIDISFDFTPREAAGQDSFVPVKPHARNWYCGDLHCHTFHSDAKGSPELLHATAIREGLDFLAVSDHNTTSAHLAYFDQISGPDLVIVPAYEFTTGFGHGNVFGARTVEDFRVNTGQDVLDMIARVRSRGQLFSINHDKPNIPWTYPVPEVDCMEVWQAPWLAGNHVSLDRYHARLCEGRRLTAIGGSDFHQPAQDDTGNLATLARPCTFLLCENLSVSGILDALAKGRSFVTEAPGGPRLILSAGDTGHGGEISGTAPIALSYQATGAAGDILEIWDATGCIKMVPLGDTDDSGVLALPNVAGFLRGQIVADASRSGIIAAAQAHVAAGNGGRLDWSNAWSQPVVRALTSPIYVL